MSGEARAAALREAFDASFALPVGAVSAEVEDLLNVHVAGVPYSFRLREVAGLVARRPIIAVPSRAGGLLGLAGIRGEIVPVFGLAALLDAGEEPEPPRWLILSQAPQPLAFAFSQFDGFVRVPKTAVRQAAAVDPARPYFGQVVSTGEGPRPLIGVGPLVATLRSRLGRAGRKEQ